jgi:2-haloacid dehalogenase
MNRSQTENIKFLAFDVFGTVVDWRSSVIAEGEQLGKAKSINIKSPNSPTPGGRFTGRTWTKSRTASCPDQVDDLHRMMLAETLKKFDIQSQR